MSNALVPELDVSDLQASLTFYVSTLGFEVVYERREETFAFLRIENAELMRRTARDAGFAPQNL